ncbi:MULTISPECIES: trpE operon leader peptide TrpLE [unclassified Ensifer]|nr:MULTISPECIES: trpE operon leader peptide TrpLE [unclassified Ensifer]
MTSARNISIWWWAR